MSYYRLISSLPDVQQHLEAIDKVYFSAQVKHLDGNTVQINKVYYINPEYLEIGVWTGETFKNIHSTNKDGVDPGQYCDSPYVNYKMTSDGKNKK